METTREEREWLRANWNAGGKGFREWVAGSVRAHALVPRLIRDVDALQAEVGALEEEIELCPATSYHAPKEEQQ